jgi:hypothetical protein
MKLALAASSELIVGAMLLVLATHGTHVYRGGEATYTFAVFVRKVMGINREDCRRSDLILQPTN